MSLSGRLEVTIDGERVEISPTTLEKYNQPGPRYTSYPTAPEWDDGFGPAELREAFAQANARPEPAPLSLYFHFPFCESLCLYCGCNVVISKNHAVASPYLERLKREIDWVSAETRPSRKVEQLHFGGGTPTYLTPGQIEDICARIHEHFSFSDDAEVSVEVDPRVTTGEHCRALRRAGFNRISIGIQDFDPLVQKTVRRVQSYADTQRLITYCRELGYESINVDLIYGLPHQTAESFSETLDKITTLNPDRIAVFSYAHVPWMKKQQGSFARFLPEGFEKFRIFSRAIEKFTDAGYRYIGLDHFARLGDEICRAQDDRTLHRNFQGYTTRAGCDLYAMGVSSISGLEDAYAQNWRDLPHYYEAIDAGRWPMMRGMRVSAEDKLRRSIINRILCHCVVRKDEVERDFGIRFDGHFAPEIARLGELERDGLVRLYEDRIEVAALGRIFIRNIAMAFDAHLNQPERQHRQMFSKTL
ncbi:MAG TPA: oxygen-independent coproporphyrinogen III oxidase [Blastocatellia bacterium]|nr:oxygen-independent coproporphyrinogen III oxidase [Blastocatellia bacterium]